MAAYKEAILIVTCPYSKCNPPLRDIFYSVIGRINIKDACTQSADNLFHSFTFLCNNYIELLLGRLLYDFT